jgi:hypothetical protein
MLSVRRWLCLGLFVEESKSVDLTRGNGGGDVGV